MTRNFWRGVIAGSVLAAVATMLKKPQRKPVVEMPDMGRLRRLQPRRSANRMIRGVSRTMDNFIKKR